MLEVGGKSYIKDKDKANHFAKTYRGFAKISSRRNDRYMRKKYWGHMKIMQDGGYELESSEKGIKMEELKRVIATTSNDRAPGPDDIPYEFLKNLGPRALEILLHIFQRV